MADAVYTPRNILLTGGAGFIGSHVCTLLATKYPEYKACALRSASQEGSSDSLPSAQVVVVDKLDYCASLRNLEAASALPNFKARSPSDTL